MLNPVHLRTLQIVVREGSFSRAARQLGYSSSAVSQQISTLEREVGRPLFDRGARSIVPTSAARYLADHADRVLSPLRQLQDEVDRVEDDVQVLRFGCFYSAVRTLFPAFYVASLTDRAGLRVTLTQAEPPLLITRLAAGDLDVAMVHDHGDVGDLGSQFAERHVVDDPFDLIAPDGADCDLEDYRREGLAALRERPWVAWAAEPERNPLLMACDSAGFQPHIVHTVRSSDLIPPLVAAGLGYGLVARMGRSPEPGTVAVPTRAPTVSRRIVLLHRVDLDDALVDWMASTLRGLADDAARSADGPNGLG